MTPSPGHRPWSHRESLGDPSMCKKGHPPQGPFACVRTGRMPTSLASGAVPSAPDPPRRFVPSRVPRRCGHSRAAPVAAHASGRPRSGGLEGVDTGAAAAVLGLLGGGAPTRRAHESGVRAAPLGVDRQPHHAARGAVRARGRLRSPTVRAQVVLRRAQAPVGDTLRESRRGVAPAVGVPALPAPRGLTRGTPPMLSRPEFVRGDRGAAHEAVSGHVTFDARQLTAGLGQNTGDGREFRFDAPDVGAATLHGTVPTVGLSHPSPTPRASTGREVRDTAHGISFDRYGSTVTAIGVEMWSTPPRTAWVARGGVLDRVGRYSGRGFKWVRIRSAVNQEYGRDGSWSRRVASSVRVK